MGASTEMGKCGICYEEAELLNLCSAPACSMSFCSDCWAAHIRTTVEAALYAVPQVRCPGCATRVSSSYWFAHAEASVTHRYLENARALLSVRCCVVVSYFEAEPHQFPHEMEKKILQDVPEVHHDFLRQSSMQYIKGEKRPEAFLDDLIWVLPEVAAESLDMEALDCHKHLRRIPSLVSDPERR